MPPSASSLGLASLACAALVSACGPQGSAPALNPVEDQVAFVNSELRIELTASDPDLDPVRLGFDARPQFQRSGPDVNDDARLDLYRSGEGVFRWIPTAADVGTWTIDFHAWDDTNQATESIVVEVTTSVGEDGVPRFVYPLPGGTILDMESEPCKSIDITVEDSDSLNVSIRQEEPVIEGSELVQTGDRTAQWRWCPRGEQVADSKNHVLILTADDGTYRSPPLHYSIVVKPPADLDCPGGLPVINHAPHDAETLLPFAINAYITDAEGLKSPPLLYWSASAISWPPGDEVAQLPMTLTGNGTMQGGVWTATVPNPAANLPRGQSAELYYIIMVQDDDDLEGSCDHWVRSPATGSNSIRITSPGGQGNLDLCSACTADAQCGVSGDNCVRMGGGSTAFCFSSCTSNADCPSEFYCSASRLTSVDGVSTRQCIPQDLTCDDTQAQVCDDDYYEENDTLDVALNRTPIAPGTYRNLVSCSSTAGNQKADEDWYPIYVPAQSRVTATIQGGDVTDLDLALVDRYGNHLLRSQSLSSSETVSACIGGPTTYYLKVHAWGNRVNDYELTYTRGSCD